ncbi:MAG: hypothetical protein H0X47_14920 [Nitrospirales bacterium]|nr:hypothetical protein [Nitrospirales bacterium]
MDGWAKEAERANDPYDKALAEYYNQNFIQAKALFQQSADLKLQELAVILQKEEALQKRKLQVIEEAVERLKGKGDAAFSAYQFEEALDAYEQALTILPKGQLARLWTDLQMDIANANWAIGIRTEGQKLHECLTRARQAYAQGEKGYAALGQQEGRAAAQVGLGLILQEQGIRTGGEEGQQLLAQAVAAYRAALKVRTREQLPQPWAMTQNNLGAGLQELGIRTGGEKGQQLLAEAEAAYEKALEVFTREGLPGYWMLARPNLAEVYLFQGNWEKVQFEVLDLADDPIIPLESKIAHRLIQIVALAGEGKRQSFPKVLEILKRMVIKQNPDFFLTWNSQGTKHFIGQHEAFAGSREWLVALLNAFSGTTRDTMLAAVKTAQTQFMAAGSSNKILPPQ